LRETKHFGHLTNLHPSGQVADILSKKIMKNTFRYFYFFIDTSTLTHKKYFLTIQIFSKRQKYFTISSVLHVSALTITAESCN